MIKNTFRTERFLTFDRKTFIIKMGQIKTILTNGRMESQNYEMVFTKEKWQVLHTPKIQVIEKYRLPIQ